MMSPTAIDYPSWNRSQWITIVGSIVIIHVAGLFLVSERVESPDRSAAPLPRIRFHDEGNLDPRVAIVTALQDPLVFVRLEPRVFSDVNWLGAPQVKYSMTNRVEPWRWLSASPQHFGDEFRNHVSAVVRPSAIETRKPDPLLADLGLPLPSFPATAVLHLEGGLVERRLISKGQLPPNESTVPLTNTIVRILVDRWGETVSAALIFGSGSPKADQNALTFAKQARFNPAPDLGGSTGRDDRGPFASGRMVFQWFPVALQSRTNPPTVNP